MVTGYTGYTNMDRQGAEKSGKVKKWGYIGSIVQG